jgi:mono/diheme cytochrome c family protein
MKGLRVAGLVVAVALASPPVQAVVKLPDDVSIRMKLSDTATVGPRATLTVKNVGTNTQNGVTVRVFAESELGLELWSGTVDVLPGKSAVVTQRVWLDEDTTTLVATATLAGVPDQDPSDNAARGGLGLKGRSAKVIVGRAVHLAHCASCHGTEAAGGSGPAIVGATWKTVLARAAAGGDHDFPWMSKTDAKNLGLFLKDPAGVVMPPPLPTPPVGGWPTYAGSVKALLDDRCVNCHGPSQVSAGIRLDNYNGASNNARRALASVKLGKMPKGTKRFTAAEIGLIADWISGGSRP